MYSYTEENYVKAIFQLSDKRGAMVSTNAISAHLNTKAASVTDMLKKLAGKGLVDYVKYQGARLSSEGKVTAVQIVRKHRLWETFLVKKLGFGWDEVHEIAEELEHIRSAKLIDQLDEFLGFPQFDPHGDPIPTNKGIFMQYDFVLLSESKINDTVVVSGVKEHDKVFLQHLDKLNLTLGRQLTIRGKNEYDGTMLINDDNGNQIYASKEISDNILVTAIR